MQGAGYKVVIATGIEGAKALLNTDQQIDVLFLDLNLGGDPEAGLMVAQQAQAQRPKLSYLYTTGAGVNAGMKAMFVAPFLFSSKALHLGAANQIGGVSLAVSKPTPASQPAHKDLPQSN